jgi:CheY-like chemotaxis protein
VYGIVKDHNGFVDVRSIEGEGTTFELYFPCTEERISEGKKLPVKDYSGSGERILVVDDVKEQREILSEILTGLGYSVITLSSGEKAVEYLKTHSADLLILDMIMGAGYDGFDTYKRILESYPEQRAIIVSGYSKTDRVREAQILGAGQYVKKPYTFEKIGLAVKTELER